jgi:general secretion pathway protein D
MAANMLHLILSLFIAAAPAAPLVPEPAVRTETVDGGVRIVPDREVPVDARDARALLLEFGETSLYDLTLFFADVMRLNMLISDQPALEKQTVQLIGHETMSLDSAWQAYLSALRAHDFTTSQVGDLVTIVPSKDARRRSEAVRSGVPTQRGERIVTHLLPVDDGDPTALAAIVKPLLSDDAEVVPYAPSDTLIVTDSESNVRKVGELLQQLAVAAPETTLKVTALAHARAADVKAVVEALHPPTATPTPARPTRRKSRKAPTAAPAAASPSVTKVLEDARTNSLIVLATTAGHEAVDAIVAELDRDADGRQQLHVVRLTYALAEEVEAVLARMAQGAPAPGGKEAGERTLSAALQGAQIAADPSTNALAILADEADFTPIRELIAQLDVARRQVFVDAVFVELTSDDGREFAVNGHVLGTDGQPVSLSSQTDADDGTSFSVTPGLLNGLAAGVFGPLIDVIGPAGDALSVPTFGIAMRALQSDSDVHVMGNPALLVLDHQEASLAVGRKIPFASSTTLSQFGTPIEAYDRVDVNMELKVTPHVNAADLVTLDVELDVDEVDGTGIGGNPLTSGRSVHTNVMVEDGQTIVIAGVTSAKEETIERKVPVLGDIPLIGALFRSRSKETRNSNLMVFLTPYVIERPRDLLRIHRLKEAQRQEFVRRFQDRDGAAWLEALETLLTDAGDGERTEPAPGAPTG